MFLEAIFAENLSKIWPKIWTKIWLKFDQNMTTIRPKNWTKIGPKLDQNWTKIGPKLDQNWTKIGLKLDQNWTKIGPKLDQNWTKIGPKRASFCSKLCAWFPSWTNFSRFFAQRFRSVVESGQIEFLLIPSLSPWVWIAKRFAKMSSWSITWSESVKTSIL